MTVTDENVVTGVSTIEGIDLEAEVPCWDETHDHPADLIAGFRCPRCKVRTEAICWQWWGWLKGLHAGCCNVCRTPIADPASAVYILEVLR